MRTSALLAAAAWMGAAAMAAVPSGTLISVPGSPFAANANPCSIAVADFNGDGKPDLAVANEIPNTGAVTVLLGDGSGRYRMNQTLSAGADPCGIATGDFNGDRVADLAVANYASNTVSVYLGDGHGSFVQAPGSPVSITLTGSLGPIAVGDFNSDGKLDIVVGNVNGNAAYLLLGNGAGGFAVAPGNPISTGYGPASFAVADFNGDGKLDLAVANRYSGPFPGTPGQFPPAGNAVTVLLGNGNGGFTPAPGSSFGVGAVPVQVIAGDFNGDGRLDLAVGATPLGSSTASIVAVLLGNGLGGFTASPGSPWSLSGVSLSIAAADFNGDGLLDLAASTSTATNNISVLLGNGFGGFAPVAGGFPGGQAPTFITAADLNGDGRVDLAVADIVNGIVVLMGAAAPTTTLLSSTAPATLLSAQSIPLRAQVSTVGAAFSPPAGSVTFLDGATQLATIPLAAGVATYTVPNVTLGPHNFRAVYNGDARTSSSTSNALGFAPPVITITGAANGASFQPGIAAPNTILSLFGSNFACTPQPQVMVNGTVAEVLAAVDTQINFVTPASAGVGTASVQVSCGANVSQPYPVPSAAAAPAIFTASLTGAGQASVLNQDWSLNAAASPASPGDYISIYGTGLGSYGPPDANGLRQVLQTVAVFFGDFAGSVQFAGQAPGYTSGLQQINVQIPAGAPTGSAVPIRLTAGSAATQQAITIAVR